jgi:capping protein beta
LRLLPHHTASLLNTVDLPTKPAVCPVTSREYLVCDYNRDGDSYRSPWSGEYDPPTEGLKPSEERRKLEVVANEAFDTYRSLYYEGGVSSVYVWDVPEGGFMAAVLIKKETEAEGLRSGQWDAIHVIEVSVVDINATYKLTTTVILHLDSVVPKLDEFMLAGSITRQNEQTIPLTTSSNSEHVANMGRLVEEMESRMRNNLQEIYFGKTHDLVNEIRPVMPAGFLRQQADLQREMAGRLAGTLNLRSSKTES